MLDVVQPGRRLEVREGVELFVHDNGEGPPLVLLHGVGLWSDDWIGPVEHMGGRFRTIRFDARGQGRSAAPAGPWTLADFSDDVAAVLDCHGVERASIAGFSMGGLIAQSFALRYPQRVERLAILAATTGRSADDQQSIEERLAFLRQHHPASYFRERACPRWFTPEFQRASPEVVASCEAVVAGNDHTAYVKAYEVLVSNDLAPELHHITCPTLVLTAENDIGAGPIAARLIADRIDGARLIVVPRLRHHILLEAPDIVGGILREFFTP